MKKQIDASPNHRILFPTQQQERAAQLLLLLLLLLLSKSVTSEGRRVSTDKGSTAASSAGKVEEEAEEIGSVVEVVPGGTGSLPSSIATATVVTSRIGGLGNSSIP